MHSELQELIWLRGREQYRDMPWREDTRAYYVLVSEVMLQQTQVARVVPKFEAFITAFADEQSLARADLADVLKLWQGLGYNRRAKYLHQAAVQVVGAGGFRADRTWLETLPGVGKNTAGAILAYSFNQPELFIETNIRTVLLYHCFDGQDKVDDKQLLAVLGEILDTEHPREFYWALMDYGSYLKASGVRNIAASRHYKKQSPLKGSMREMRGTIISKLALGAIREDLLAGQYAGDKRFAPALTALIAEGLVARSRGVLKLGKIMV